MIPIRRSVARALVARWDAAPLTSRPATPALVHDAGVWRGITAPDWIARFRNPLYLGNRRRRSDRVIRPSARRVAA